MIITFDKKLKTESFFKLGNEVREHISKEIQNPKFFKNFIVYYLFFLIFLTYFCSISYIYTCKKILEFSVIFLVSIRDLSKNYEKF